LSRIRDSRLGDRRARTTQGWATRRFRMLPRMRVTGSPEHRLRSHGRGCPDWRRLCAGARFASRRRGRSTGVALQLHRAPRTSHTHLEGHLA
jgi:hypothetical protein